MKHAQKWTMATLAALLAVTAAGCSGGKEEAAATQPGVSPSSAAGHPFRIVDEPLELSIHLHYFDLLAFKDEWPIFQKAADLTNIKLKGKAPQSATKSKEVFNIMLASGNLPDIIHGQKADINKAALDGAFIALDDLIDKHAPHLKQYIQDNPWVKKGSEAADGKLYFVPYVSELIAAKGYFIRKDWLDKLGLDYPKTVDEYYRVLKAFKEQDPNGNGKADEVPFFNRGNYGAMDLLPLFGARSGWYEKDGKVHYGKYEKEYGYGMTQIAKWYKEGLIDKEIFTRGSNAREALLGSDVGGSIHDYFGSTASYNDSLKEKVPGIQLLPFAPPANVNGKVMEESGVYPLAGIGWGISAANKHPVETIKYFDFWFTEEGRRLNNFGLEGQHYTMKDGKPVITDAVLNNPVPVNKQMEDVGAQIQIGVLNSLDNNYQWMNPIAREGTKMYVDNQYIVPQFPQLTFTEEEQKIVTQKWASIDTYIKETEQRWIMGAELVEPNFANYIARLKEMGMDEVLKAYNDAYGRFAK
ncbi:extracellular solute-binding protein [Paenibacillus sp. YN15]|uniref:extracellular solute-binding protein n=1 Tax=Paenibacillus sp. YN15 TaxID=1742774 RepID=UPI000DCBA888|nr:extracellular solute-binding protein [Paenibacillus sp. YN15]RAV05472.1 sugar ABC transporter permease [Paenibacillus sp. YN15]